MASAIQNWGTISGTTGILVEKDVSEGANTASQVVVNHALIEGTAGLAMDLGAGDDSYTHDLGAALIGGADFGAGSDEFWLMGTPTGLLGGAMLALFDGGVFQDLAFGDLTALSFESDIFSLTFGTGVDEFFLRITAWENIFFADRTFTAAELAGEATPAVPLPAGVVLMLGALGGLGLMRRKG